MINEVSSCKGKNSHMKPFNHIYKVASFMNHKSQCIVYNSELNRHICLDVPLNLSVIHYEYEYLDINYAFRPVWVNCVDHLHHWFWNKNVIHLDRVFKCLAACGIEFIKGLQLSGVEVHLFLQLLGERLQLSL